MIRLILKIISKFEIFSQIVIFFNQYIYGENAFGTRFCGMRKEVEKCQNKFIILEYPVVLFTQAANGIWSN